MRGPRLEFAVGAFLLLAMASLLVLMFNFAMSALLF